MKETIYNVGLLSKLLRWESYSGLCSKYSV